MAGTAGLAGCLGSGFPAGGGDGTETENPGGRTTASSGGRATASPVGRTAEGPGGKTTESSGGRTAEDPDGTEPESLGETATEGPLDLREANVTAVAVEPDGDGARFDVTLYRDDDGEDGYADWWQVETLDGERLGRRELLHAHGTREFTRSETVAVPDGVDCVVVRGHDETHGYGGRAALVTPATGATRAVRQGPGPDGFAGADCP